MGRLFTDLTGQEILSSLRDINETLGGTRGNTIYGFHVNANDSNPDSAVVYLRDAVGMTPAYMDYTNDVFNYGSWGDAFFLPRPCMLKSNGERDYYLDPTDYTKKADGTASDVANTSYDGNAMMEWGDGRHLIWMKVVADANDDYSGTVYIADHKADDGYTCYPFINSQGNIIPHFYTPIYNGSLISNKLRSISGQTVIKNKTAQQEINYAKANYNSADQIWNTEVYCDIQLINALLILISKSLNTQTKFGQGNASNSSAESNLIQTGTMNAKGLFWGENTGVLNGVKVFGMENFWGNQWRRFAGLINDNGTVKAKMTYGREDGSTADGYNLTGSGYVGVGVTPSGSSGGYINKSKFTSLGIVPATASGSATTYYCDGLWFNNSQTDYAFRGGDCHYSSQCGTFSLYLYYPSSHAYWGIGASPSCKPLL